ncbi:MAG: hypothetical protein ACHQAZ_01685 [Gammaproteobacteria bacterium]
MPLGLPDVADLLERSSSTRKAILIGGQALNVFAVHYHLDAISTAVSEDIDFFGDAKLAREAGKAWHGKTRVANIDDQTASSALVLVELHGETHQIDFMSQVLGVNAEELQRWAAEVEVDEKRFYVMHPIHVLQSQTENIYGQLDRRAKGIRGARRVGLAINVAERQAQDYLDKGDVRAALRMAERTAELAQAEPGLRAWHMDRTEIMTAIPLHKNWPIDFLEKRLPQLQEHVSNQRAIYPERQNRIKK